MNVNYAKFQKSLIVEQFQGNYLYQFLIFRTFDDLFFPRTASKRPKFYRQMHGKLEEIIERLLAKLHPPNLMNTPSILTLRCTNCVKFHFGKSYLPSDSHTNTVISVSFAYPSR